MILSCDITQALWSTGESLDIFFSETMRSYILFFYPRLEILSLFRSSGLGRGGSIRRCCCRTSLIIKEARHDDHLGNLDLGKETDGRTVPLNYSLARRAKRVHRQI